MTIDAAGLRVMFLLFCCHSPTGPLAVRQMRASWRGRGLEGTTIDGEEFDSSYKRGKPTTFAPNQVCHQLFVAVPCGTMLGPHGSRLLERQYNG